MKISKVTLPFAVIVFTIVVTVFSCKKKTEPLDTETATVKENSLLESTIDDVVNIAAHSSDDTTLNTFRSTTIPHCAKIDHNKNVTDITFNGKTCSEDGHIRSGKLTFHRSGPTFFRKPGFKIVISSTNYSVNGNATTINLTLTNTTPVGFDPNTTRLTWSISGDVTVVKGTPIEWTGDITRTLLNTSDANVYHGPSMPISWNKARIGVTGSAKGITSTGESYTTSITSELVRDFSCYSNTAHLGRHPFIKGKLNFTPNGKAQRELNFGDGTCDSKATVTISGTTYNIILP